MSHRHRAARVMPAAAILWACAGALAQDKKPEPERATMTVRLKTAVSTTKSKVGDKIDAVSVTPLTLFGRTIATPGCTLPGTVLESQRPKGLNDRESVVIEFPSIVDKAQVSHAVRTTVIDVDNGRETVDDSGRINGVAPVDKKPDSFADTLKIAANGTQIMRALASKLIGRVPPQIDYKPGAELILRMDQLPTKSLIECGPVVPPLAITSDLSRIVTEQPLRTTTRDGEKPSDVTNLVFVGSRDVLFAAFAAAGWVTAEALNATSGAKTFLATVAGEGYKEAPVSLQFIDGRPPDAVFQKQLNTFAKRHHVRIWQRDDKFNGETVWLGAATHDVAFAVSKETKSFAHSIHPNIDLERLKIVTDLSFAGVVSAHVLVPRPKAPREAATSIGEKVHTDGKAAVLVLRKAPAGK